MRRPRLSTPEARALAAAVLGTSPDATDLQARAAWRAAVRRTHPDHGGSPAAFEAVQAAWTVWQQTSPEPVTTQVAMPPREARRSRVIRRAEAADHGVRTLPLPDLSGERRRPA